MNMAEQHDMLQQSPARTGGSHMDIVVMLETAQALTSETSLARVIDVLLESALRYSAAQKAALCLLETDGMFVVARSGLAGAGTEVDTNFEHSLVTPEVLPTSIAYATRRSKASTLRDDASKDPIFGADPYVIERALRSVMCIPLIKQGTFTGLLYIESEQVVGAFTVAHVKALEILATQAAISIENAKLYQHVRDEHEKRVAAEGKLRDTLGKLNLAARATEMGELLAFVIHEVSQPVSAVGTCSRAAMRWLERDIPNLGEAFAMLQQISVDSRRATEIIESMSAVSKKSLLHFGDVDIHASIREVIGLLREKLESGHVTVSGSYHADELIVTGDRILLQQVIMNLVSNALDALAEPAVGTRNVDIRTSRSADGDVWISVSDTGAGVDETVSKNIFESFTTTKQSGLGMGLAICKSVVEAHGGVISVSSAPGQGTCFRFSIPKRD